LKSKGQRCPFAFLSSRFLFHPRRLVTSGATETAHGKNLSYLNSYNTGRFSRSFAQSDGVG
jgi:hypothetical protein